VVFAAIVPLMQGDIRRALGTSAGRRSYGCSAASIVRSPTTTRSRRLSSRLRPWPREKTGALIVVERSIGLRNYIESGIPLDAHMTYDLLVSIFQPTSPLHDGAVVVQGDRVAAAACFLPLTVNPRLSRELGSRHRAAIGVTEENDAVAITVSEETGIISLVMNGAIERNIEPDQLRLRLASLILRRRTMERPREAGYSALS
jgi:diadenylate cyclase